MGTCCSKEATRSVHLIQNQLANIVTKGVASPRFQQLRDQLTICALMLNLREGIKPSLQESHKADVYKTNSSRNVIDYHRDRNENRIFSVDSYTSSCL